MSQDADYWFNANITELVADSNGKMELFGKGTCTGQKQTFDNLDFIEFR